MDHQDDSAAKQAASKHHEFSQFPKLGHPLGNCAWKGAWVHLRCASLSRHVVKEEYQHAFAGGPEHTLAQIQEICKKLYGWKPQPNDLDLKVQDGAAAKISVHQGQDPPPPNEAAVVPGQPTATTCKRAKYGGKKMLAGATLS